GDSAFGFSAMEVETMARYGMDVLIFVINNGGVYHGDADDKESWTALQQSTLNVQGQGSISNAQEMNEGLRSTSLSFGTSYQNLATMVGGLGLEARTVEEVEQATRQGFECAKVCVVNVIVGKGDGGKLEFGWQASSKMQGRGRDEQREKGKGAKESFEVLQFKHLTHALWHEHPHGRKSSEIILRPFALPEMASKTFKKYGTGDEKFETSDEKYRTSGEPRAIEESEEDSVNIDLAAERRALRKVDWHIWPMIFLMFSFIDSLTGITSKNASLIACRLLLGLAEGPLFPSLVVYMNLFYTRKELAVCFGYLIMGGALAGAVGGLLAYAVGYMDGTHGMRAWRWLLIIEDIPSVVLGIFSLFFLADSPDAREEREASSPSVQTLRRFDVKAAFKDWKVWAFSLLNFPGNVQLFTYAIFQPTIIKEINPAWSFINSAIVSMIVAYVSDTVQHRAAFALVGVTVSILGHVLLIVGQNVATRYAGCFVVATGLFVLPGIVLAWLPTNLPWYGKRSTAVGMQLTIGNCVGVAAPFVSRRWP
ncbi:MAG: hypothetical protein Q9184_005105, partial [Pyrenodesmia sp. 2 TL-2023]